MTAQPQIIPVPASLQLSGGDDFTITEHTSIHADSAASGVGDGLAAMLRRATGYPMSAGDGSIRLELTGAASLGDEGYQLDVEQHAIRLKARTPAGLFHGVQTLRQLLPPQVESAQPDPNAKWTIPQLHIVDQPRLPIRGATLDVARHFFPVADVKKYIDDIARYKLNTLVLHLSDDQGWRLAIDSWPKLATYGGSSGVNGTNSGFYTKDEFRDLVNYAAELFITIVPEFDFPGHVNAALASYPELNCDGKAPALYTGIDVGFSSMCISKPITYRFLDDVIREVAELTPGPYLSLGGDEAHSTSAADYRKFLDRAEEIVHKYGKTLWGWHQIAGADIAAGAVAAYWGVAGADADIALAHEALSKKLKLVLAPADHAYLDMKYSDDSPLGLTWAGVVSVEKSYDWDPDTVIPGVSGAEGVLAPIWAETLTSIKDIEYMAFPRLPGIAEIGWSPANTHNWTTYKVRLAAQEAHWKIAGINYYRAPDVPWQAGR